MSLRIEEHAQIMAYLQVRDILAQAEKMRNFLRNFAEKQQRKASNDLLAGLFHEVNKHEKLLEQCLEDFELETTQDLLDTWIQFSGDDELEEAMASLSGVVEQNDDNVLEKLLHAEETLLRVYNQAHEQTSSERLQELFESLIELQDHHLRNIANCVSEYEEMRRG